jgi:apolipoprotein N-acyltransferase
MAFMLLGYTVADYPAIRVVAHILGEYGISTLVLLPNLAGFTIVAIYLQGQQRISARTYKISTLQAYVGIGVLLSALGICFTYGAREYVWEKPDSSLWRVAIIQTNIASNERIIHSEDDRKRLALWGQNLQTLTKKALAAKPNIIVLPEGAPSIFGIEAPTIFSETIPDPLPSFEQITAAIGATPYVLVVSTNLPPTWFDQHHNSTSIVDNQSGVLGTYQKRFLMPWGEYTPYLTSWAVRLFGINWDGYRHPFVPGKGSGTVATPIGRVALRMCSELLSPQLNREAARENVDIIIFSSSTAILHGSPQLQDQTLAIAQLRAAVLGKPLIYAANSGRSFALNSRGDILWQNEPEGEGFTVVEIPKAATF